MFSSTRKLANWTWHTGDHHKHKFTRMHARAINFLFFSDPGSAKVGEERQDCLRDKLRPVGLEMTPILTPFPVSPQNDQERAFISLTQQIKICPIHHQPEKVNHYHFQRIGTEATPINSNSRRSFFRTSASGGASDDKVTSSSTTTSAVALFLQ